MSVAAAIVGFVFFTTLGLIVGIALGKSIAYLDIENYFKHKEKEYGEDTE